MIEINTEEFQEEVIKADTVVAVVFSAPWCGFCDSMYRVVEAVKKEFPHIKFCKVDLDKEAELSKKYTVRSVPTTIVFSGGTIKDRKTGLLKKSELINMILKASPKDKAHV